MVTGRSWKLARRACLCPGLPLVLHAAGDICSERVQCQGTCGAPGLSHSPQQHRGVQVFHVVRQPHSRLSPPVAGRGTVLTPGRSAHRPLRPTPASSSPPPSCKRAGTRGDWHPNAWESHRARDKSGPWLPGEARTRAHTATRAVALPKREGRKRAEARNASEHSLEPRTQGSPPGG